MPRVTSVELQKSSYAKASERRGIHRYNIYLDGEFAFGADEDLMVDWRLVPGKVLNTSDVERLLFEAEVGKLMERMYRLFNLRQRSEKEVRDYLRNLSFKRKVLGQEEISEAAIELLINKLKQKGLLSDEQFAKAWVQSRRKTKKKGKIALKAELHQKGINQDLIEEVLEEESTPESEKQLAQQALVKKIKTWRNLPLLEFRKKSYEFLLRRGFEYEVVREVIETYLKKR